ncbi:MAG: hypothetical protein IKW58_01495 [Alphaproteobacteria bacterium]|nr:hypothetical protein [Alphaproteobacteria bacterium]
MYKFFCFFVLVFMTYPCLGNDVFSLEIKKEPNEIVVHKIDKEIITLPNCNDEKLIEETKDFILQYYKKHPSYGVKDKRRKHFVLKYLNLFTEENIANYKTQKKRPVSDLIASLMLNEGIIEENIKICKNSSNNKEASELYLLLHADNHQNIKAYILNLQSNMQNFDDSFFIIDRK